MEVKGTGSIIALEHDKERKRCRKWQLRLELSPDPSTGKRRTKSKSFSGTYREAEAALREWTQQIASNDVKQKANITFNEAAKIWQAKRKDKSDLLYRAANTTKNDPWLIRTLSNFMGAVDVASITPDMIQKCYLALQQGKSISGEPLSGTYINKVHTAGRSIYNWLMREGVVASNPFTLVSPPPVDTAERKVIPPEKIKQLMQEIPPDSGTNTALLLNMMLGLRSCESCALDWADVDFTSNTISITKSRDLEGVRDRTKTAAGMRTLPLMPDTKSMLETRKSILSAQFEARERDIVRKKKDGTTPILEPDMPICCDSRGNRTTTHSVSTNWRRIRSAFDLDGYTPHDLRHSYLSMLYANGCDLKVLQKIAGHSRYSTTVDIYVHTTMDDMRSAMSL